jgi:hypothetical protein
MADQNEYVVLYRNRDDWEVEDWETRHPDGPPCPPRKTKYYIKSSIAYRHHDEMLSLDPKRFTPSAGQLRLEFGAEVPPEALIPIEEALDAKYPGRRDPSKQRGLVANDLRAIRKERR